MRIALVVLLLPLAAAAQERRLDFDGADAPLPSGDFSFAGSHWQGGRTATEGAPGLYASGAHYYAVSPTGAQLRFDAPVDSLRFFYVHGFGYASGTATAFDAGGDPVAEVSSRPASIKAAPGNFVDLAGDSPIAQVEFSGGVVDHVSWATTGDGLLSITPAVNGSWVNTTHAPLLNGQGLLFEYFAEAETLFIAWFTFDENGGAGEGSQRWLTAQGHVDGNVSTLNIISTTGGIFDRPGDVERERVGSMTFTLVACDRGTVTYDMPGRGLSGSFEVTRHRSVLFGSDCG